MVFSPSLTFKVINLLIPDCLELEQFSRSPLRTHLRAVFDVYFRVLEDVYHQDRTWTFGDGWNEYSRFISRESDCTLTLNVINWLTTRSISGTVTMSLVTTICWWPDVGYVVDFSHIHSRDKSLSLNFWFIIWYLP